MDTYVSAGGRTITRRVFYGREGEVPFKAWWFDGHGDIGDRIIGKYRIDETGTREVWGEMFNAPNEWTAA